MVVTAKLCFGTKRKADIDRFNKLSADACAGILWNGSVQIELLRLEKAYEKAKLRIELTVNPL